MPTVDLTGKSALVTGSSRGLDRYYTLHLAQAGADVIIHDVNEGAAAEFGEAPSPAVLRSNTVVEPLEERGCGGRCAAAAGVEREKHPSEEPRHLWGKVARLASREDLLVSALS
jgi:NAD(P)-dependent dehydrogenase (short-subunit alcohol dehydrogenase family)